MKRLEESGLRKWVIAAVLVLILFLAFPHPSMADSDPTNEIVRSTVEKALKKLNSPMVEIIAQGSWISNINYRDPRFQQMIEEASDHDMRPFFRSLNISDDAALEVWKRLRMNVMEELNGLVSRGIIKADELAVIRNSINIYPPEQLMKGVQTSEEAVALFVKWGIYPSLAEVGKEGSQGSYGALLKFERQGYETGERAVVLFLDKGVVRAGSADLNHMLEGHGKRTAEAMAKAAEDNLADAMKAAKAGNLKDTQKYTKRAAKYLEEAKKKLRSKANANDSALRELQSKLDDLLQKFEAPETATGLLSEKVLAKTAEGAAAQKQVLGEFSKTAENAEKILQEAADDSLLAQKLGKVIEESKPPRVSALFRGLLEGTGKWAAARTQVTKALPTLTDYAKKIGFLNALMAYWTIKDLPEIYVKEGASKAAARFSMSLATMAVPELALGELVALIATTVAEVAVDYVAGFGYQAVTSTQDCFDLIAGVYTVYGRESQIVGDGLKKCHQVNSIRDLACDVYDKEDVGGYLVRTGRLDPKGIPSELKSLIACHAENASKRVDEETKTDKGVEEALIAKCTGPIISAWLEGRGLAIEEVQALLYDVDKSELRISYDTTAALALGDAKQVSFPITATLLPLLGDLPDQIKAKAACPGGRGSKPYVYQNWTWKVDGSRVTGASGQSLDVTFDKHGSKSVCVEWEMEYGVLSTASTLPPPGLSGKILKSGCVKVTAGEELEADKMVVTITGPNKSKAPEKGETGKEIALSVDIKSKRDPKEFECRWTLEGGYGKSTDANDDRYQAVRYDSAGTYTIKVEVYDRSDVWKVKDIKSEKLAEAVHKITVEPSVRDAKIEAKVSGPSQATVGDTIELSVEVIADERIKAKLKPPVWFMQPGGIMIVAPSDEDPMNEVQTKESIGRGPKASYKTTASGRHDFSVSLYGEGVNGAVTGASHRVDVGCRKTDKGDQCRLEESGQKTPLSVEIIADRTNVNTGETVNLTAVATGGNPVYQFTWSGAVEGQGIDTSFVASATKRSATVEAKDQKGQTAKSSVAIAVDKPPVLVEGLKEKAVFGTSQTLRVPLEAGNTVLWQSSPTVAFKALESTDGTTTVTFDRMGKVKVWAEIRTKKGEIFETVNSSDPVEVAVAAPDGKIEFDPASQVTGKQVTAEVKTGTYLGSSLVRYVWLSPPTSNREELTPDKIRFSVPDRKGIPIEVEVRATRSDDTVLSLKRTYDPDGKSGATEVTAGDDGKASRKKKEVADWLAKAKEAVAAGKLDEGITLAGKAAGLDPSNTEVVGLEKKWQTEKQTVTDASQKARTAADGENFTEAEKHLSGAKQLHPKYQPVVDAEAYVNAKKDAQAKKIAASNAQMDRAKKEVHLGKLDEAEQSASEAVRINPKNTEAAKYIDFIRKEKQATNRAVEEVRKLIEECRFPEAQNALIPIKNRYPYYPPVEQMDPLLSSAWFKWDGRVKEALGAVHMANERKEFAMALDLITKARTEIKPDRYANEQLAQQEEWAKRWKAQKDRQIGILKAAGVQVRNYDYAGALKSYDEGFANGQNIYNGAEPEYKEAVELRNQAYTKNKRLNELIPWVRKAAYDKEYMAVEVLQSYLKTADEAIALQPPNGQLKQWHAQIVSRIEKTKADNERIAQGRRHLDVAGGAERGYLTNESALKAGQITWGEKLEEQQHIYLTTAIENYRASLKYIPDGAVEKQIRELETTLEGRKKYLENYRLSVKLRSEADALASRAYKEPDFEKSLPLYDEAAEKYRKSLTLYRPGSAEMMEKQIWNLDYGKHDRMVKKYWADGQALEKQGNIVGALSAYDKAIASFHPAVPQNDRMWAVSHAQDLRNRIAGAKTWRADGEAKQSAGKIAEAIASYRQSLKLLPDAPLEEHVRMLEGRQTEANEKKAAADRLWQEGTALFNQGRLSDALGKFKESLGYWSDSTRTKYAADIEARRNRAASLREEGARLQGQNRITEALAKYRESMSLWPDTALSSHMATLEAKLKEEVDTAVRKAKAKQLRDEGYALQQKDQLQAAIGKYRESLAAWPDKQLEDYIRQLEVKIASAPPKIPVAAGAVPSRDILTSKVWQFCRSDGTVLASKMRLLPDGRIEGAAHSNESRWGVLGNELFLYDSAGKAATRCNSFRQVGGRWEISGPFLLWGNITHVLREVGEGGGPPAPPPTVTSAPPAPSASWSGTWNADPGPGGEVVTFLLTHTGAKVTGTFQAEVPYTGVSGAKQNKSLRGAIDGNVSGSRVTGSYRDTSDWHLAGNFEFTMAAGGNLFTAVVRGEDVNATYTVRRIGAAASVKTSGSAAPVATSGAASSRTVAAEITNQSRENTHVFTEAESFGPQNRLAPGEKRKVTVTMKADGSVVFKAGRNGQVMATKTWRGIPGDPSRVPVVVFDDANPFEKLLVTTGLR